jgi:hypothetical protein
MKMKKNRTILVCLTLMLALFTMACAMADVWTYAKGTAVAEATGTAVAKAKPATAVPPVDDGVVQSSAVEEIFTITSVGEASNGASEPTVFSIDESWLVTEIKTYHWNNGKGVLPGNIGLTAADGTTYGPWQATGFPGQGGVENAYWVVSPQVILPAGSYTVVDSDPATWAKNDADTGGMGMTWAVGIRQGNP